MGYYLNSSFLGSNGKAVTLINKCRARVIGAGALPRSAAEFEKLDDDKAIVCVIKNGLFDAACVCYKYDELKDCNSTGDDRPKVFLLMDKQLVIDMLEVNPWEKS